MLSARLDSGLLRLLAVIATVFVLALIVSPGLPLVFVPAVIISLVASIISYRIDQTASWWIFPAVVFVGMGALTLFAIFAIFSRI